ncbi:hypothetical protein PGTUg99_028130 [Puccinia graminis f. sp. tritici]|uniref:Tr-type G domain-containing protein n=1 Tax=Puccinia graminis f. sp. tritici TaxID=56615 RepID=A0A5B0R7T5_PUCGR|nr:hypothetical protein PGTUg99_028130 [Puccinia graminis f. sp. tritici]
MQTATLQEDRPTDQPHNQNGNKSNPIINFQKEIDEIARKNHQPSATTLLSDNHTHTLVSQLENSHITADSLLVGLEKVNQVEPGVPLKARLLNRSSFMTKSLATYLEKRLVTDHELIIYLGPHNLHHPSLGVLFQSEYELSAGDPAQKLSLTSNDKSQIIEGLQEISNSIGAEVFTLWDGFQDEKVHEPQPDEESLVDKLAVNDEAILERWNPSSMRLMIRSIPESAHDIVELRVACVGNVDSGKSTTLGVLTKGKLDDGRGRARVSLFRHKHELDSGRTSSVGMEIMGFDAKGREVRPDGAAGDLLTASNQVGLRKQQLSWDDICKKAAKVVSFIDLAGHERYLKTTIFGLTGCSPDFVLLIIGANAGLIGMSKEHLSVALALSIPVVAVITKVDMTPANVLEQTVKQLVKILKSPGCRKVPVFVKNEGMSSELAQTFIQEKACPIFMISNVTGNGIAPLKVFLNSLPAGLEAQYPTDDPLEFTISDAFSVPFVGTVVSGVIVSGHLATGQEVWLGPDGLGHFQLTIIKSIQRKRVHVDHAHAGQSVSLNLKRIKRSGVRKGMVILSKNLESPPKATKVFEGQVLILYHNSTIQPNYQAMLHVGSVRQTVKILSIEKSKVLRTGDRAKIKFEFMKQPEFVKLGQKLLFREGKTKGLGVITKLL